MNHRSILVLLALSLVTACAAPPKPLQIEPAGGATPIAPKFTDSYYYYDRDQNLYFVMRGSATDPGTQTPVDQVATIRVFWRPKGGVTTLNPTALNATLRYLVMTPDTVAVYEGAGFVRLNSKTGAGKMNAQVMDADMHLTQYSVGFVDTLGRARLTGTFAATYDDARAVDMMLDTRREFFTRSLESRPATQPATQPAAAPGPP
jgi:hypothetical protein